VRRLAPDGVLYYNQGQVAHVGTSGIQHAGRLPTVAEFYLLGKSHCCCGASEPPEYVRSVCGSAGDGSLVGLGSDEAKAGNCAGKQPAQIGVWKEGRP